MDVMVAPERQRQGLGEVLFRTWDRNVGASLGLGLSESSYRLFQKLRWPDVGPVPCLVKPLTRRALRRPNWPVRVNRLVSALTLPIVKIVARTRPLARRGAARSSASTTASRTLWEALAPKFDFAVRRDAAVSQLEVRVGAARPLLDRGAAPRRPQRRATRSTATSHEPRGRVTLLVDFLADPDDERGLATLLRWVDREARQADSDKIRAFAMHAGFRRVLRRSGYFQVKSTMEFVVEGQRRRRRRRRSTRTPSAGTSRSATRIRIDDRRSMHLLVGIDTEGDNQWDAAARAHQTFENIYALPRLHALFARHGVRPTYVITHPVATRPAVGGRAARLLAGGDCEIGAHHHAWETPPCTRRRRPAASRTRRRCRARSSRQQLASLTERDRGARSASGRCRTARAGSASRPSTSPALERHGYLVESSVAPLFYEAHKGGPDFVEAPLTPYFLAYDSATRPGTQQRARGAGVGGAEPPAAEAAAVCSTRARRGRTRPSASCASSGSLRLRWLRPSYSSLDDMIALARRPGARAASRCSTCSSTRARPSSAAARTTGPQARARRLLRSARALPRVRHRELGATPVDVRGVPAHGVRCGADRR